VRAGRQVKSNWPKGGKGDTAILLPVGTVRFPAGISVDNRRRSSTIIDVRLNLPPEGRWSMSRETPEALTPAEWKVMRIVWQHKTCAARDVAAAPGHAEGGAPSTVKTLLRRLVDKGYLTVTQVGNSFLYRPTRPALKSLFGAADVLLANALEGTV